MHTAVELLEASMTSKNCFESLKDFRNFVGVVSAKLVMFEINSNRIERSFVIDFHSII